MIKNIFIPEKIGSYYPLAKRIIGFDIGKTQVNATQIYLNGSTIVIEKFFEEKLEVNTNNHVERVGNAIAKILSGADKYDALHTALSSSLVIFKELKLPFTNHDKIKMVINYEIEPLLPFSMQDATIDFIITKQIPQENSSEVLVAAVQNQHIAHHLEFFTHANIHPSVITVDIFGLYGLYQQIPRYAQETTNSVLIDLGFNSTRIAYLQQGQLRLIRTLPKGVATLAKTVSEVIKITPAEAMQNIIRFGLEKSGPSEYTSAINQAMTSLWREIEFTLTSFTAQTENQSLSHVVLFGGGAQIKEITGFVEQLLKIPTELFQVNDLLSNKKITTKQGHVIPFANILSLACAFPTPINENVNLLQGTFAPSDSSKGQLQIIAAAILILILLLSLIGDSFFQLRRLRNEVNSSEQEVITALKERFKKIDADDNDLEEIVRRAKTEVNKEEELWFSFSSQNRSSFLKYLLELHTLDKDSLGLRVEAINISRGTLTLKAQVRDHEALQRLERALKLSPLFAHVEPQEETNFSMKIILAKNREGRS